MADQSSETMPHDVRQAFVDAVRLFDRWKFDTPAPTLPFRTLNISLSGVCDLVLAYKNEPLPLDVHHELLGLIDHGPQSGAYDRPLLRDWCAMSRHIDPIWPGGSWGSSIAFNSAS